MKTGEIQHWDLTIRPQSAWYDLRLKEIIRYKDLLMLFVRRDFVSVYKQTILGPIWFFIQPIITALTFTLIFGRLAGISTEGIPYFPFYLASITLWNYFADSLTKTSETFTANANIFGKVYFPRLIVPLSIIVSNLVKFGVQLLLFLAVWIYYVSKEAIAPHYGLLALLPLLILLMGFLGLACGIIISSLTTKYRDLKFLVQFGVQLLMYASPIVYPLSLAPEKYRFYIELNPVTSLIETFKAAFLGTGGHSWEGLLYSLAVTAILFMLGIVIFTRVEKSFMDTV